MRYTIWPSESCGQREINICFLTLKNNNKQKLKKKQKKKNKDKIQTCKSLKKTNPSSPQNKNKTK